MPGSGAEGAEGPWKKASVVVGLVLSAAVRLLLLNSPSLRSPAPEPQPPNLNPVTQQLWTSSPARTQPHAPQPYSLQR